MPFVSIKTNCAKQFGICKNLYPPLNQLMELCRQCSMISCFMKATLCIFLCILSPHFIFALTQEQTELVWSIKDELKKVCSTNDLKELLIANKQQVPSGETNVSILYDYCEVTVHFHSCRPIRIIPTLLHVPNRIA